MEKVVKNKNENILAYLIIALIWVVCMFGLAYLAWVKPYF